MALEAVKQYWNDHGTKLLGVASSITGGFLTIPDLISQPHVKYVAAANVVLGAATLYRGFTNTRNLQQ